MTEDQEKNVKFIGNIIKRDDAIRFIDKILKEKGQFEDYADLSGGFDVITHDFRIQISDDDDSFTVVVESISGPQGELSFTIDKNSGTLYRLLAEAKFNKIDDEDIDFLDDL